MVGPRILRVGACSSFPWPNVWQAVDQRLNVGDPLFEILGASEAKRIGNPFQIRGAAVEQGLQKANKTRMRLRWRLSRTPEIRLAEFLGGHLQIVQEMALLSSATAQPVEQFHVGLSLQPPQPF